MELVDSQSKDEGQDGALGTHRPALIYRVRTAHESEGVTYPKSTASRTIKRTALRASYTRVEQWWTQPQGTGKQVGNKGR
jgi:hypothetical protein